MVGVQKIPQEVDLVAVALAQEQAQVIPHEAVVAVAAQAQGRRPRHNIDLRLFLLVGMPLLTCLFCSLFTQNKNGAV
jgi:hypothetical protein